MRLIKITWYLFVDLKEQVQSVNIVLSDDFLHDIPIEGRNYLCGFQAEIFSIKYSCFKI
jgi:hypothetical protein